MKLLGSRKTYQSLAFLAIDYVIRTVFSRFGASNFIPSSQPYIMRVHYEDLRIDNHLRFKYKHVATYNYVVVYILSR